MNVCHTVASLEPHHGGPSRSIPALADALRRTGIIAEICADNERRGRSWLARADLIHDHGIWLPTNHRVAVTARQMGIPRIVSVRGMLEPWSFNYHRAKKRAAWYLYQSRDLRTATAIHVTSRSEGRSVRQLRLLNPLVEIPNGVDVPSKLPPKTRMGKRRVLFLSRLHEQKGLEMLLDAWAQLRPDGWELVIAGPDTNGYRKAIARRIRADRLDESVLISGPANDDSKWTLYRSADVFVLPSYSESFGLVVAEALAAEIPVVTTKGTPWQDLIAHRCGWWVDVGIEPLASVLREAVRLSDDERREMGLRGRALVSERYTWSSVAERMNEVYRWILEGGDAPACVSLF